MSIIEPERHLRGELMKNMKIGLIPFFMSIFILLSGCGSDNAVSAYSKYNYEFLGAFDTVIQFMGYAKSQQDFEKMAKIGEARFVELNKLFDIYNDYDGINNIKTINDNAGIKPVEVSQEVMDLIQFSKDWYNKTGGYVNIALGPVLSIWHNYREAGINDPENAELPPMDILHEAAGYTDINKVIVDKDKRTVFLSDKNMSLDVGAVAKGYSTEIVAKELEEQGFTSFIISSGGNVRVSGKPLDGVREKWGIGIQNPDGDPLNPNDTPLDTAFIESGSVVTSGDYQRYYMVNSVRYNHIIDSGTLMPADHYRAVTVYTKNSGEADFLSTTLFILPYDQSRKLAEGLDGVEALWIMPDGTIQATDKMKQLLKNMGGATNK